MRLAELHRPKKDTSEHANSSHGGIEDPDAGEGEIKGSQNDILLVSWERANKVVIILGEGVLEGLRFLWANGCRDRALFVDEHVLVDDCADDDGYCGGDLT